MFTVFTFKHFTVCIIKAQRSTFSILFRTTSLIRGRRSIRNRIQISKPKKSSFYVTADQIAWFASLQKQDLISFVVSAQKPKIQSNHRLVDVFPVQSSNDWSQHCFPKALVRNSPVTYVKLIKFPMVSPVWSCWVEKICSRTSIVKLWKKPLKL